MSVLFTLGENDDGDGSIARKVGSSKGRSARKKGNTVAKAIGSAVKAAKSKRGKAENAATKSRDASDAEGEKFAPFVSLLPKNKS